MKLQYAAGMMLMLSAILTGCDTKPAGSSTYQQSEPPVINSDTLEFNTSDKSIATNNNLAVAAARLKNEEAGSLFNTSQQVKIANLTKSPYSSLGKVYRLTGQVYKVEELPPNFGLAGNWGEILMIVGNANSAVGATTIDFIYNGDISKVNSGETITCSGYFIGTFESENSVGGNVESVVLLGNSVRHK